MGEAASALLGVPVEVQLRGVHVHRGPRPSSGVVVALAAEGGPVVSLELEPALAARIAARVVSRELPFVDPARALPPEVNGAAAAFVVTLARRVGHVPWRLASPAAPPPTTALHASFVVLIASEVMSATCTLPVSEVDPPSPSFGVPALASLGEVPLTLTLVAAQSLVSRAELALLQVGAAWAPGRAFTLRRGDQGGWVGEAALVAPRGEVGLGVRVEADGGAGLARIVLTPALAAHPWEAVLTEENRDPQDRAEPLGDAEVVVRVEVATLTLPARAWAAMTPGDVLTTGARVGEAVSLRAGGVVFARGELCEIDGEIAVRIVERHGATS